MDVSGLYKVFQVFALAAGLIFGPVALGAPGTLTYQGRIVGADGRPLNHSSVAFEFTILSQDGLCIVYRERRNGVDMRNSQGLFDVAIGSGGKYFPTTPGVGLPEIFSNDSTLDCEGGATYTPLSSHGRVLRVQFHDGAAWRLISPDAIIRSVPFASYATSAAKLGGRASNEYFLKTSIPVCPGGEVLTSSVTGVLSCVVSSGSGISTLTGDVTASGSGSVATTISSGAVTTSKIADGNVTGMKLENSGVTAGTYPKVTVDAKGRVTVGASLSASDIPTLDAAKITSGVLAPARLGTGTADNTTYLRGDGTWQTVATSTSIDLASQITGTLPIANGGTGATSAAGALSNLLPTQTGNNGKVLQTDGANATWVTPAASGITALTGEVTASGTGSVAATIANNAVTTAKIIDGAVSTNKIADGNVTGVKLENSGVTAGTYGSASSIPSITVDAKGRVTSVSANAVSGLLPAASGSSGKYLKSDGTNWAGSDVLYTDIKNAGGLAAFAGSACAANQALGWSSVTDSFVCQAIGSLNASAITAGTIATARLGSGTADNTTYLRGDGTWATVSTADATKLPLAGGTMAGAINMNGNQITNISNVPFVATNPAAGQDGQTLRWNNTTGQWEWFTAGAAGSGIATINGLNGSAQTLAPSSSATSYGFSSAGSTHTLSIPSASTAGVTAGTISKTEYDAFNAKQAAGNYITTMTGDVTSSGFTAGSVTTTIANNAVTTAKIIDAAVTTNKIADGNVTGVKLENSGVTAGTYPKVTVDAKGRVTVGASLSASDIPNLDAAKIASGVLDPARLGTGTADNTTYLRGDGTWQAVPSSGGTVTSITAGAGLSGGTITGSGTIGLGTELTGVNSLATTGFVRRTGAGTYATSTSIDLASQITGTLPIANGGTGATTANGALTNLLPTQTGNNGKVLQTDGANVTWVTPAASGITALTGDVTASGSGSAAATIANNAVNSVKINDGSILGADMDFTGVNSATTNFVMKDSAGKFFDFACSTTGHVPTWTVSGFACQAPLGDNLGNHQANQNIDLAGYSLVSSGNSNGLSVTPTGAQISSASGQPSSLQLTSTGGGSGSLFFDGDGVSQDWILGRDASDGGKLKISAGSAHGSGTLMTIQPNGFVGIGAATAPTSTLTVYSSIPTSTAQPDRAGLVIEGDGDTYGGRIATRVYSSNESPHFISYRALGTKASPTALTSGKTMVSYMAYGYDGSGWSANSSSPGIVMAAAENWTSTAKGSRMGFFTTPLTSTSSQERVRIDSEGRVGIGTTSPAQRLDVAGNIRAVSTYTCIMGDASGAVSCSSDRRLKKNIQVIPEALSKILSIRGVEFDWNEISNARGRHDIGVIAQEIETVFPTVVHQNETTGYKMVDYASLVAPLIEAVKELYVHFSDEKKETRSLIEEIQKQNEMLKAELALQKQEVQELKIQLEAIKSGDQ